MDEPLLGQISIIGFDYEPRGWAFCNGQTMSIAQNQALFSILGTTYGGDGISTFRLPDLRGRAASGPSRANPIGSTYGQETVTLALSEIPPHTHSVRAVSANGTSATPNNTLWASSVGDDKQYDPAPDAVMAPTALQGGGQGAPHDNMHPHAVLNYVIALQGIYPSRN